MIEGALASHGLIPRGGFNFEADEAAPRGRSGNPAKSVLLIGQAGAAPWPHFQRWRDKQPGNLVNPLDTWARQVIEAVAVEHRARVVYPSDRPYLPFQRWAMRAEGLKASPLGILIHPEFGLWHAYRGALLFDEELPFEPATATQHPCETCVAKPCLCTCPVGAVSDSGYDYAGCLSYVRGPTSGPCRLGGCLARNACPVGAAYRYPAGVQAFHMASFARL